MKAKNRKPPDARGARVEAMPAVGCSCIFEEVLPIVAASLRRTGEAKKRWVYSNISTIASDKKTKVRNLKSRVL